MRNRINLNKAEDARLDKDWDLSNQYLDTFRTGFFQDRDIQGDPLSYGRAWFEVNCRGRRCN